MSIIKRPFYWPNGNGGINIFLWNCGCSECGGSPSTIPGGGGTSTVPSGGGSDSNDNFTFVSDNGDLYNNMTFTSDNGDNFTLL